MKTKLMSSVSFSNREDAEKYVKELKEKLAVANAKVDALKKKLCVEEIDSTIWALERAYFVGDSVYWEETCRRGCCIEDSFSGQIIDIKRQIIDIKPRKYNTEYTLKNLQTGTMKVVSGGDFKRR